MAIVLHSRSRPTHSDSSARLENNSCEQKACILALLEDSVISLFTGACRAAESSLGTKKISFIQTIINKALGKYFQGAALCSTEEDALQKCVVKSQSVDGIGMKLADAPFFAVTFAKFIRNEAEMNSLHEAKMESRFTTLPQAIDEKSIRIEAWITTNVADLFPAPSPPADISDDKKTNLSPYSTATSSDDSDFRRYYIRGWTSRSRRHSTCSTSSMV